MQPHLCGLQAINLNVLDDQCVPIHLERIARWNVSSEGNGYVHDSRWLSDYLPVGLLVKEPLVGGTWRYPVSADEAKAVIINRQVGWEMLICV